MTAEKRVKPEREREREKLDRSISELDKECENRIGITEKPLSLFWNTSVSNVRVIKLTIEDELKHLLRRLGITEAIIFNL